MILLAVTSFWSIWVKTSPFSIRLPSFACLKAGPPGTTIATDVPSNTMPAADTLQLVN